MNTFRLIAGISFALAAALVLAQGPSPSRAAPDAAAAYPNRAIRLVVDTSPGGITHLLARLSAEDLVQKFGHTHTLMIAAGGYLAVKPFLERSLPFDPLNGNASQSSSPRSPRLLRHRWPSPIAPRTRNDYVLHNVLLWWKLYYHLYLTKNTERSAPVDHLAEASTDARPSN